MPQWKHHRAKPVIGLAGGIGSGKSTVARMFGSLGCMVIDSDAMAHEVLQTAEVKEELRTWLGEEVFDPDGSVNRKAVARRVFGDAASATRLNGVIHPRLGLRRDALMAAAMADTQVRAVLWDAPLLFEAGLGSRCDAVVFVDVPEEKRRQRLMAGRGWDAGELAKREKLQFSLDNKRQLADYYVDNSGDEASTLRQVRQILSQILTSAACK